jgi:hypothetical protein
MKLWEVNWYFNNAQFQMAAYMGSSSSISVQKNKRLFSSKDKAEELYKKLYDAAKLLQASSSLNCTIDEVEIE